MLENFRTMFITLYNDTVFYIEELFKYPVKLITLIIDLVIVIYLVYKFFQIVKETRAWQLLKGIALLIIATMLSSVFNLNILNYILTSFMTYRSFASNCYIPTRTKKSIGTARNK